MDASAKGMTRMSIDSLTRQHIEAIADQIAQRLIEPDRARDINRKRGWTYDIGTEGSWNDRIRHRDVQLSAAEMELAIKLADYLLTAPAFEINLATWWHKNALKGAE